MMMRYARAAEMLHMILVYIHHRCFYFAEISGRRELGICLHAKYFSFTIARTYTRCNGMARACIVRACFQLLLLNVFICCFIMISRILSAIIEVRFQDSRCRISFFLARLKNRILAPLIDWRAINTLI